MFPDDGSAGRAAGHFIFWQAHSTRDHLSLTTGKSGSTPAGDCHAGNPVPPDGEGGCLVAFQLRETSACRAAGHDCRHEAIAAAPPFSPPNAGQSPAISQLASPAFAAATHALG